MAKPVSWSYSSLNAFETCPWRFYLQRVKKAVPDVMGEEAKWGVKVHELLAKRMQDKTPLPDTIAGYEPIIKGLEGRKGMYLVEQQLALNAKFEPTQWFAKDAWLRAVVDLAIINGEVGALFDYKTGKRKPDNDQLELFSAVGFAHYPALKKVTTGFIWLQDHKVDPQMFTRDQISSIWAKFLPRVKRIELAHENNEWPKRPSGLCRKYCPVGMGLCEHCGQ